MLKIDRRVYLNMLACFFITLFATKECYTLHFLRRKSVVDYIFYNES